MRVIAFLLSNWKLVVLGIIVLILGIQTWRLDRAEKRVEAVRAEYAEFKGGVAALGVKAKQEALEREKQDKERKEKSDAENAAAISRLESSVSQLRRERDAARSRFVSAATTCPASPEDASKYRTEFERAYRSLVEGLRAVGNQCSRDQVDLNTARRWAQ